MDTREPPNSIDAEREIIGALFLAPEETESVAGLLQGGAAFYQTAHSLIYRTMLKLVRAGKEFTWVTVANALKDSGDLEASGGMDYMRECTEFAPSSIGLLHAAQTVSNAFKRRRVIQCTREAIDRAYRSTEDVLEVAEALAQGAYSVLTDESDHGARALDEIASHWLDDGARRSREGTNEGMSTGFETIDDLVGGLHGGRLYVLAARPGVGKTAFALNLLTNVARASKAQGSHGPLMFSLEMADGELIERVIAAECGIDPRMFKSNWNEAVYSGLERCAQEVSDALAMRISDTPGVTIQQIVRRAKRVHSRHPVNFIVVDYIGLVHSAEKHDRHDLKIGAITGALKNLARELRVPVLALSQLNRDIDKRQTARPRMSDLKDSSSIEQDADQIWFLTRAEHKATLIVEKNRAGRVGEIGLWYDKERTAFSDKP